MTKYTPESLLRYKEDHAPRFMFRWMRGWYDAWAADRQRIRELEDLIAPSEGEPQRCEEEDGCPTEICRLQSEWREMKSELASLLEENQRLRQELEIFNRGITSREHDIRRLKSLLIDEGWDPEDLDSADVRTEQSFESRWHTATGGRPEEIDGYPLGDMDVVEVQGYPIKGSLYFAAKDAPWSSGFCDAFEYRRVYLDGVPCVVDDGTLLKEAEYVVTAYGVASATNVRPRLGHDGFWTTDCRGWLVGLGDNYTTPGDRALSLRRVWREE